MYLLCMIKARIRWCTCRVENILTLGKLLPARASEQGNVIGLVSVYIYVTGSAKTSNFTENIKLRKD